MSKEKPPREPASIDTELSITPNQSLMLRPASLPAPQMGQFITNLDLSQRADKILALSACSPGELDFVGGKPIEVIATSYVIFPDSAVDEETGEIKEFVRTVLLTSSGKAYRTTAAHGPRVIARVTAMLGTDEWKRGINFVIEQKMGKRGRNYHDIRVRE